jgi:hypothetical protein
MVKTAFSAPTSKYPMAVQSPVRAHEIPLILTSPAAAKSLDAPATLLAACHEPSTSLATQGNASFPVFSK